MEHKHMVQNFSILYRIKPIVLQKESYRDRFFVKIFTVGLLLII